MLEDDQIHIIKSDYIWQDFEEHLKYLIEFIYKNKSITIQDLLNIDEDFIKTYSNYIIVDACNCMLISSYKSKLVIFAAISIVIILLPLFIILPFLSIFNEQLALNWSRKSRLVFFLPVYFYHITSNCCFYINLISVSL